MNIPLQAMDEDFKRLARHMGKMIDEMKQAHFVRFCPTEGWKPAVNVYETANDFYVFVDLAGMEGANVDVNLLEDVLVIRGRRDSPIPEGPVGPVSVHLMEIDHGEFCREVQVPSSVDRDAIEAHYRGGFLQIRLPKKG